MIRGRRSGALPWTSEDIAILIDVYSREGIDGACDALPERSRAAITTMAAKVQVRSPNAGGPARKPSLSGESLEQAIALREESGWSFLRIGERFGVSEIAAQNAVLIALCPRKGFNPAERDGNGKLTDAGVDRLREALRRGMKAVDITAQLGVSAARVALERRTYDQDLKMRGKRRLPPPGGGARYSGARVARDVYRQVEELFMAGHGASRIATLTGVSKVQLGRYRNKLVRRLRRKGQMLPGCDIDGRRHSVVGSIAAIPDENKAILRAELMKGTPVARAAKIAVMGSCSAYKLRDELKAELEASGRSLPPIVRLGRDQADAADRTLHWLPAGRRHLILYRRHLKAADGDQVEAKRRTIVDLMPKATPPAPPKRPLSFEEQLAKLARGEARLVAKIPLRRPGYAGTIGGVATGANA